jgi:OOP family OmpA-OmpF porin
MKIFIVTFILLFSFHFGLKCQPDLIYNGDFEIYDTCPNFYSTPSAYKLQHCLGWRVPTIATSDYFNRCDTNGTVAIPYNMAGVQETMAGNGYCGLFAFSYQYRTWWFEYIQGKLDTSLSANKTYHLSFYVSCADFVSNIYIKKLGAHFSTDTVSRGNSLPINLAPQVLNNYLLSDTSNWLKIEGDFIATGGEKYITIGYFGDTLLTDTVRFNNFQFDNEGSSYYYIDRIKLSEVKCSNSNIPNVFTPNNDDINDYFKVKICDFKKMLIYNRWGQLIYKTENSYWDGNNLLGEMCSDGTYYYLIETDAETYKGFLQLFK